MRNPLADKVVDIKPSGIRKFFDIVSEMQDAISLGVGEPDFDTPWHIRDEGIYSLEKGRTFYTSNAGLKDLRQEICNTIRRKQGVSYDWQHEVLVTVGGSEAIDIGLRAMCNPGDEVLIPQPSYVSYEPCAILAGATPVIIDLKAENEFRLTAEELEAAITDKTKVLILPFPNNPTGAIMEKSDLEAIAKIIEEHDIFVMSDEIYSELTYKEKHVSIVSLPGMQERTVLINGFSKAYAMTGWRLGYAVAPEPILQQMLKIHQFAIMCAPTTSQYAAVEALKNGDEILYTSLYWRANFAVNFLARVHYITPECDRVATVFEDIRYTPSGFTYTRPERNNLYFSPARNFYPEVKSAHTGEQLPIAKAPEGVHFEPGQESVYAGKGDFYTLRYGKYLIAMNCTPDRTFDVEVPAAKSVRAFPSKETVTERVLQVEPKSTVVLIVE